MDGLQQALAVDALYDIYRAHHPAHLVGLQVPNEVARLALERVGFEMCLEFLHAIFAKQVNSHQGTGLDHLRILAFANAT